MTTVEDTACTPRLAQGEKGDEKKLSNLFKVFLTNNSAVRIRDKF